MPSSWPSTPVVGQALSPEVVKSYPEQIQNLLGWSYMPETYMGWVEIDCEMADPIGCVETQVDLVWHRNDGPSGPRWTERSAPATVPPCRRSTRWLKAEEHAMKRAVVIGAATCALKGKDALAATGAGWYIGVMSAGKFVVEIEREDDGRWIAEVVAGGDGVWIDAGERARQSGGACATRTRRPPGARGSDSPGH